MNCFCVLVCQISTVHPLLYCVKIFIWPSILVFNWFNCTDWFLLFLLYSEARVRQGRNQSTRVRNHWSLAVFFICMLYKEQNSIGSNSINPFYVFEITYLYVRSVNLTYLWNRISLFDLKAGPYCSFLSRISLVTYLK